MTVWLGMGLLTDFLFIPMIDRQKDSLRYVRRTALSEIFAFALFLLVPGFLPKLVLAILVNLLNTGWYPVLQGRLYSSLPDQSSSIMAIGSVTLHWHMGLLNARFEVLDVTQLSPEPQFDLIVAFDAIHDQTAPATVLQRVSGALAPDGTFLMIDFKFSSNVEENIGNPFAPLYYGNSVMHCLTVSLAEGGAGLGTVWGIQLARRMLNEAGFSSVEVVDSPRPQNCIYICRKDDERSAAGKTV